jgi:hypothetical protein
MKKGSVEPSIVPIILLIVILLININASIWITKLEKINCACSENFMRNYIKYFLYVMIPVVILQLLVGIYSYANNLNSITVPINMLMFIGFLQFIFGIFYIVNIVVAIVYINKLKELNCECSEDVRREVYWIYNIILASIFSILIILLLIFAITTFFVRSSMITR